MEVAGVDHVAERFTKEPFVGVSVPVTDGTVPPYVILLEIAVAVTGRAVMVPPVNVVGSV